MSEQSRRGRFEIRTFEQAMKDELPHAKKCKSAFLVLPIVLLLKLRVAGRMFAKAIRMFETVHDGEVLCSLTSSPAPVLMLTRCTQRWHVT
jgi:hypothetical protein